MEKQPLEKSDAVNSLLGKIIQEVNFKIGSGLAFSQLLDAIFESLGQVIPFDRLGIATLDEDRKHIRLVWVRAKMSVASLKKNYSAPLAGSSLENIITTGQPRIINDLEKYLADHPDSKSTKLILKDGVRSSLTCPLRADNRAVGVVFFSSRYPNSYNKSHVEFFSSIADELSIIVEQARLKNYFAENEAREKAYAKVLHDLRSPVSIIKGYLELAASEDWYESIPPELKDICSILNKNANSMMALLNELTDLKHKGGEATLVLKDVDLNEFCMEAASSGKILAKSKDIFFEVSIGKNLPETVRIDRARLRRVLDNLFTNAVKFSHRESKIKFSVWTESRRLFFSVQDQGQGIREEEISKLFTEFGRTSTLPSEGESSSGLGLFIAKSIVQQHAGEISVQSKWSEGSTFTFWIPLTPV